MKYISLLLKILPIVLVLSMACGCTHIRTVSVQPTVPPAGQTLSKLPHHVALVLDQALTDYKYEYHSEGDTLIWPLGIPLQNYARQVVGESFQQVDVVPSLEKASTLTTADLILIPRAIKFDCSIPVWTWQESDITFVVSWTAKDRATQNTVWLATIAANAASSKSNGLSNKHYQKLFDDLSLKTFNAFKEATELGGSQH